MQTFEQFLAEKHVEQNPHLLDDMIPDDFNAWLERIDVDELIKYGDEYAKLKDKKWKDKIITLLAKSETTDNAKQIRHLIKELYEDKTFMGDSL